MRTLTLAGVTKGVPSVRSTTNAGRPQSAASLIILRMAPSSLGTGRANNASPLDDTAQA